MKKFVIALMIIVLLISVWYGESRRFLCLEGGDCVTVWKTYNNTCYVILGKYWGVIKPSSESYIQTTNTANLDIIWRTKSEVVVNYQPEIAIRITSMPSGIKINDYNANKQHNDSLFTYFDGSYNRYKKGLPYMSLFILENYALNKNGEKL